MFIAYQLLGIQHGWTKGYERGHHDGKQEERHYEC